MGGCRKCMRCQGNFVTCAGVATKLIAHHHIVITPPSLKVGGEIGAEPNLLLIKIRLYIRNIRRFLNKGAISPNLLLVYLL